jgi:hypothetical protein
VTAGIVVSVSDVLVAGIVGVGSGVTLAVGVVVGITVGVSVKVAVAVGTAVWVGVGVAIAVGKTVVAVGIGVKGNGRVGPHPSNSTKINSPHRFHMVTF